MLNLLKKNKIGTILIFLHLIISVVFGIVVARLGILPTAYFVIILILLAILLALVSFSQFSKKKSLSIIGKVLSFVCIAGLCIASYYVIRANSTLERITSTTPEKTHIMAVAVLTDDPATQLRDTANYIFGVQYQVKPEQTEATVSQIREVLGTAIATEEYQNLSEQVKALRDKDVQAIIYNEAYAATIEEEYEDYEDFIRVIFRYSYVEELTQTPTDPTTVSSSTDTGADMDPNATSLIQNDDSFCVFISGIDTYGSIGTTSRSDSNIVAVVNPGTKQILLINTPRDYYVPFPGITGGKLDKLTHAGIYGVDVSMATLAELYNVPIEYYVRVNFSSFIEVVDLLGGIDVYSEFSVNTIRKLHVNKGWNTFNGEQALNFARERYNFATGDNQRGKNHQAIITAIIKKMTTPAILSNATAIMDSVADSVDTNFPKERIQELISLQLGDGSEWNIRSVQATGRAGSEYCYSYSGMRLWVMWPDESSIDAIQSLIRSVQSSEILPPE